jgi:hypothetical protein
MVKDALMIHEVNEKILSLPLENYILTFDDGLYSQYYYRKELKKIKTEKILFISTMFVRDKIDDEGIVEITAEEARKNFKFDGYMSVDEISEMRNKYDFLVGGHGHKHLKFDCTELNKTHVIESMVIDTERMILRFLDWFGFKPKMYAFPYNKEPKYLRAILKQYGIKYFFGSERKDVKELL